MAIHPHDLTNIESFSDQKGKQYIDHKPDLQSVHHPSEQNLFRSSVMYSPEEAERETGGIEREGISPKAVFRLPDTHLSHPGQRFMVKPYFESHDPRMDSEYHYPLAGWSELTNQALFHAGGIGHLHQKVHANEHPSSIQGNDPIVGMTIHMEPNVGYLNQKHEVHPHQQDAQKIALMDFLTNNIDRHGHNILERKDGSGLLAIDHTRNFHYKTNVNGSGGVDRPFYYAHPGASVLPTSMDNWGPTFEWWKEAGPKVRAAMDKRLEQMSHNPILPQHIRRNFKERADLLDQIAQNGVDNYGGRGWFDSTVPIWEPGELTPDELAEKHKNDHEGRAKLKAETDALAQELGG